MLWLTLLSFYILFHESVVSQTATAGDIDDLREALKTAFDASGRFRDLLTATVRLAFHDCAGPQQIGTGSVSKCNGCIDFENADHNNLKADAVDGLNDVYVSFADKMNPADFLAAAGTIAIEYAQQLDTSSSDTLPTIPYYFGRTACDSTEIGDATQTKSFVSAELGWDHVSKWFNDNMGLNNRETVTIIGAHTLGRAHTVASGYSSLPWVSFSDGPHVLDNKFYQNLLNIAWTQQPTPDGQKYEWLDNAGDLLMLNADMCLVQDIDDYLETNGQVICPVTNGCPDSEVKTIVQEFASDNGKWLREFAAVWIKMIKLGYSDNELTAVTANNFNYITGDTNGGEGGGNNGGNGGGGGGGRGGRGNRGNAMSMGYNNDIGRNKEFETDTGPEDVYYWKIFAMYPIVNGILLVIVIINTFIVCQIKLRGDRLQNIGIKKYESISHDDPEEISIS